MNQVQLIRHATLLIEINHKRILLDPMLSEKEAMDPVQQAGNQFRIPMTDLPFDADTLSSILDTLDAVFVTHLHRDHWDTKAIALLDKSIPLFCQPGDEITLSGQGFTNVTPIHTSIEWEGIRIFRTDGRHGTGEIGKKMGKVSGFVFRYNENSLYVAGNTIFCEEVRQALETWHPQTIVLNAGGAQFLTGGPITMTPADVEQVRQLAPESQILCVHMDTINHCLVTREQLSVELQQKKIYGIQLPANGEIIPLENQ